MAFNQSQNMYPFFKKNIKKNETPYLERLNPQKAGKANELKHNDIAK